MSQSGYTQLHRSISQLGLYHNWVYVAVEFTMSHAVGFMLQPGLCHTWVYVAARFMGGIIQVCMYADVCDNLNIFLFARWPSIPLAASTGVPAEPSRSVHSPG